MIIIVMFGAYYACLPGCKDCHWELIMCIMRISLAKNCQILPEKYPDIAWAISEMCI